MAYGIAPGLKLKNKTKNYLHTRYGIATTCKQARIYYMKNGAQQKVNSYFEERKKLVLSNLKS